MCCPIAANFPCVDVWNVWVRASVAKRLSLVGAPKKEIAHLGNTVMLPSLTVRIFVVK